MKRFLISSLVIGLLSMPVSAFSFGNDRSNYNPSDSEAELPSLPKVLNSEAENIPSEPKLRPQTLIITKSQKLPSAEIEESYASIQKGTRIRVKLLNNISDKSQKGTKITFISQYPVSTTYYTIPMGTIFKGEIFDSHKPQFTGNGGLIVIKVNAIILNGETHPIEADIVNVNSKNIFLNNIKGKRKYMSSMFRSMQPGCRFFKSMLRTAGFLTKDGSTIWLSPFPFLLGTAAFGVNAIASPLLALAYKGEHIHIDAGSQFEIKLANDVFIYN